LVNSSLRHFICIRIKTFVCCINCFCMLKYSQIHTQMWECMCAVCFYYKSSYFFWFWFFISYHIFCRCPFYLCFISFLLFITISGTYQRHHDHIFAIALTLIFWADTGSHSMNEFEYLNTIKIFVFVYILIWFSPSSKKNKQISLKKKHTHTSTKKIEIY